MAKTSQLINLDLEIVYSDKYQELIQTRNLSKLVNELLKQHFNINNSETNKQEEDIKKEIILLNVKTQKLQNILNKIEEKKPKLTDLEKAEGWFIDENGEKWKHHNPRKI